VTGGVAAYKSVELARRLKDTGASVTVVMTEASRRFITPLSFEIATGNRAYTDLFDGQVNHIRLASEADVIVVAPATANSIAKFANGLADDLLSTCFLAGTGKKTVIAPAMNWRMYENPAFRRNLDLLLSAGVLQVGPEKGGLACGEEGVGRMAEVPDIVEAVEAALTDKDLSAEDIVITAGPTREYIDPVRFITNRSSGKMGFALARAARNRGARVTLISGPVSLTPPPGINCIQAGTSAEMMKSVLEQVTHTTTLLIMAAAVADFAPASVAGTKIDKNELAGIPLTKTKDIISAVSARGKGPFIIGFAAETGPGLERARQKMREKKMNMVAFNDVTEPGSGFDVDTNRVVIIDPSGETELELMDKNDVADALYDRFLKIKA